MAGLYGEKENIEYGKVKNFFSKRYECLESDLLISIYVNKDIAEVRNVEWGECILCAINLDGKKILEIGFGGSRFAGFIHDGCSSYFGFNLVEEHVGMAGTYDYDNCKFQVGSGVNLKIDEFLIEPLFDIILVSPVLLFINNKVLSVLSDELNKIIFNNKQIFFTVMSTHDSRLTLKNFYFRGFERFIMHYGVKKELLSFFEN